MYITSSILILICIYLQFIFSVYISNIVETSLIPCRSFSSSSPYYISETRSVEKLYKVASEPNGSLGFD